MGLLIIAAVGKRGEIGFEGSLPWHLPEDLKRFKNLTRDHAVIMGRKTFESIIKSIGRPLPDRKNIIITRNQNYTAPPGCIVLNSLEDALREVKDEPETFIIGGGEIYKAALPYTDRLCLTIINAKKDADVYFPDYSEFNKIISEEKRTYDGLAYTWVTLER